MRTEGMFARIENLTLTRDEFFEWLVQLPHVRKEFIESKRIQTIEYWINCHRLATKIREFARSNARVPLRTEKVVYPEACKEALAMSLIPPFNFV